MIFVRTVARNKSICSITLLLSEILLVRWVSQHPDSPDGRMAVAGALLLALPVGAIVLAVLALLEFQASRRARAAPGRPVPQAAWEAAAAVVSLVLSVLSVGCLVFYGGLRYRHNRAESAMPGATWTRFASARGDFTASFPSVPEESTQTVQHPSGPTTVQMTAAAGGPGEGYLVSVTEMGVDRVSSLDVLEADLVGRGIGTLLGRSDVVSGSVAGRELLISSPERFLRVRIFATDRRVYQVIVIRPSSGREDILGTRFLESFTLHGA